MEDLERLLREHPFSKGLKEDLLKRIVSCARNVVFREGEYIFHEGEEANYFYLIRHGRVAIEIAVPGKPPITIQTLHDGDILGFSWLIPPYYWIFDAKALELTRALALDGNCLRKKCEEDHELGYEFLKRFSHIMYKRLQAARLQLLDIYGSPKGR